MKYLYLLLALSFLGFTNTNLPEPSAKVIKYFKKELEFSQVSRNLFISQKEVSNADYHNFLDWTLKNKGVEAYRMNYPDTMVWVKDDEWGAVFTQHYFSNKAYNDYPVVGISYVQAMSYSSWLAERINENKEFKKLNKITLGRLPSEREWMLAARGTLSDTAIWPWEGNSVYRINKNTNAVKKPQLNIIIRFCATGIKNTDTSDIITTPVESYWPNTIGLYNICGNVAEWTLDKKSKGGSWGDTKDEAMITYKSDVLAESYTSRKLGFRTVLEIK